jgi:hypothetical protein
VGRGVTKQVDMNCIFASNDFVFIL